jgi:hypothetical protein
LFQERAEARALLWQAGEFDLLAAVDTLEAWGRELGIDPDIAQQIMAAAFAAVRDDLPAAAPLRSEDEYEGLSPSFAAACRLADLKRVPVAKWEPPQEAPRVVVEALMLALRERGVKALDEPDVERRLAMLSATQMTQVGERLLWRNAVTILSRPANFERSWRRWKHKDTHKILQKWLALHGEG